MKERFNFFRKQFAAGKPWLISFIVIDLVCLVAANHLAAKVYLGQHYFSYTYNDYRPIVLIMVLIDIFVTVGFDTLHLVLRRNRKDEIIRSAEHVAVSLVLLAVILFTTKTGASFSRAIVYIAYFIYFILLVCSHTLWKAILQRIIRGSSSSESILLITTDRFVDEGIQELEKKKSKVTDIFLLKNMDRRELEGVQITENVDKIKARICWKYIEKIFIYGIDYQTVPDELIKACSDMGLSIEALGFEYRVMDFKTIANADPKLGALSFLEGKIDIPFSIRRVYWITETEADLHRGFHAHKLNCQLLFCPYGVIDIILDDGLGNEKKITLDEPYKGLLLMPGMWREMVWRKSGSVLCVLASEYYDADEYIRNYDEFITYKKDYIAKRDTLTIWREV